ncbi:MAG: hypothetical protein ABI333_23345 [bacterium]
MAKQSRTENDIRRRMDDHADDPERVEVLSRAGQFKRSWVELGEVLSSVRSGEAFERWGFATFAEYCRRELHIRKATAEKLTTSFGYLNEHAPHILKRDGVQEPIPQPDTVHALARARETDAVPDSMFSSIQADAFSSDVSPSSLARKFREAMAEPETQEQAEGHRTQRAVSLARKLADLLADMHRSLPNTLAADVEEQLGRLISYLNEEGPRRKRR